MNAIHEHDGRCPSRLRFDRLLAGELEAAQVRELEQHANGCARCSALLAELRRGYQAFSPVLPDAVVQRVRERSAARGKRTATRWLAPLLAAAGVLLAMRVWPTSPAGTAPDLVRSKGGRQLTFFVKHDGAVRPGIDGERVQPGDGLEFAYSSERDAYLAIVSIDAARKASAYYAKDGQAAKIGAANRALLDQSTLLDGTLGPETVYTLLCAQPIAVAPLLQALERAPDAAPAVPGCTVERHQLLKVAR